VPASLKAVRLRCAALGLRRHLPYALAYAGIYTKVADTSAATTATTADPLSLKVIIALGSFLPHALSVRELSAVPLILVHVVHVVKLLSLERKAIHATIHAMRTESARTRHHAAVTASASAAPATSTSQGFAPRVDCTQERHSCCCNNKNDFCAHKDCPVGGTINGVRNGLTNRRFKANHKIAN